MLLFALLNCTKLPEDEGGADSSATDDSEETDSDTDVDSDTDTDANCSSKDLKFGAQLRDANGNCTSCASPINVVGTVTNTCETGWVEFTTPTACMIAETLIEYQDGSGEVHRSTPSCDGVEKTWRVDSGETKQEFGVEDLSIGTGTYSLTITFADSRPSRSGKVFDIQ